MISVAEIKKAIIEKVEKLSWEEQLEVVLEAITKIESNKGKHLDVDALFEEISSKYVDTLRRLAQ